MVKMSRRVNDGLLVGEVRGLLVGAWNLKRKKYISRKYKQQRVDVGSFKHIFFALRFFKKKTNGKK